MEDSKKHTTSIGSEAEMEVTIITGRNVEEKVGTNVEGRFQEVGENINFFNKGKLEKQKLRKYIESQEIRWEHMLDLFHKSWLVKKDVELKSLALKAEIFVQELERDHDRLMNEVALKNEDDVMKTLIDFGELVTRHLRRAQASAELMPEILEEVIKGIKYRWKKTHNKITLGIDGYIEELDNKYEESKGRKGTTNV